MANQATLFFDIETTGLNPWTDRILTFQHKLDNGSTEVTDCRGGISQEIRGMLADQSLLKVGHNATFDLMFLRVAAEIEATNIWDTMLAERTLRLGLGEPADLASMARKYGVADMPLKQRGRDFRDIAYGELPDWFIQYARTDVEVLPEIVRRQSQELEANGLLRIAQLEFNLVPVIVGMQHKGVLLDRAKWFECSDDLLRRKQTLELELDRLAGLETEQIFLFEETAKSAINWQSHVQVLKVLNRNDVNVDSTSRDALEAYLRKYPRNRLVDTLLTYKSVMGLARFDLPKHISERTNRIHPHYDQLGARTGRTSCSDPNLQNIPNPKNEFQRDIGIDFRESVVPANGSVFVVADYSQIELRILAELANEQRMIKAFRNDRDIHLETARWAYNEPEMLKSDVRRLYGKSSNFCIVFGGGAETLARLLGISVAKAKRILNRVHEAFPGVGVWMREAQQEAFRTGFARTIWGRKRFMREPNSESEKAFLKRVAINTPVQGTAADIAKRALVRIQEALPYDPIVLFVHDEIVVETKASRAEEVKKIVDREMVAAGKEMLDVVPVKVDSEIKRNWGITG